MKNFLNTKVVLFYFRWKNIGYEYDNSHYFKIVSFMYWYLKL